MHTVLHEYIFVKGLEALIAQRDMVLAVRDRVAALVSQGKSLDEVISAKPTASFDKQVPQSAETAERFIREVAKLLVERGADVAGGNADGQTPAHMTVIGGNLETLRALLEYGPPLEQQNAYGGTVLGQTFWSAAHGGDVIRFIAIIETLLAAGAVLPR